MFKRFIPFAHANSIYEIPVDFDSPKTVYSIIYDEKFLNDTTRSFLEFFKDNLNKMV